jgi:pimeloyl-ACP methyl ester carboxylesterase
MPPSRRRAVGAPLLLGLVLACQTPIGVKPADPRDVHRELTANVLTDGRPSDRSLQFLERRGLREAYEKRPAETLLEIHRGLAPAGDHRRLATLSELAFDHALQSGDRLWYGMSAIYAYALLFPGDGEQTIDPSDPRYRLAFDLYNRGFTEAMAKDDEGGVALSARHIELPVGTLDVTVDPAEMTWAGHRLAPLVQAADIDVRGLRNRYRRPGIGAPLAAGLGPDEGPRPAAAERLLPGLRVPATALLRLESPRKGLASGALRGRLEIYTPDEAGDVEIDGRRVPLEFEVSAAFAASLADSPFWSFERAGFFSGTARMGSDPVDAEKDPGLLFLQPYQRGRIPIVLVHGTASSPARWADLVNELTNERVIWDRYQIWLFFYNTGNPVGYSGSRLRRALERAVADLDPGGSDAALRRMVVIGHSQGGLLAKLTAVDSGDRLWRLVSDEPLDSFDLEPETRDLLRRSTHFAPEPFVGRVVFVCTPHRGSYLASFRAATLLRDLISLPGDIAGIGTELVTRNPDKKLVRDISRMPTSLDNMTPGNPFLQVLAELPVDPRIKAHSIIAVKGDGPLEDQSDGVVRYSSAHLEGVESELVVHSGHSAQGQPATIEEIRRILLEHAAGSR